MKKILEDWPQKLLLIFVLIIIGAYSLNQIRGDFDTYYHLAAGRYFAETGQIRTGDIFSYTNPGGLWITHEWLAQVLFFYIYYFWGIWGLIYFSAALAVITYFFVYKLGKQLGANPYLVTLLIFPLAYLTLELWIPRPQIFSYLFFILAVILIEKLMRDKDWAAFLLIGLIWLWANVHASVIFGLIVIFGYLGAEIVKKIMAPKLGADVLSGQTLKKLAVTAMASFGVAFLNPNTYKAVFYFRYIGDAVKQLNTQEWAPLQNFLNIPQAKMFLAILIAVVMFFALKFYLEDDKKNFTRMGLILGVALMPFISIRYIAYFPLVAVPFLAAEIGELPWSERLNQSIQKLWVLLVAFFCILGALFLGLRLTHLFKQPVDTSVMPVAAVDFITSSGLKGPGLSYSHDGGYLEWKLWPGDKVFLDSKSETYAGTPAKDYATIIKTWPGWEDLLNNKYKINYFLLSYDQPIIKNTAPLIQKLLTDEGFSLVFWDDAGVVLVRNAKENKDIIKKYGLTLINPFLDPATLSAKQVKPALTEAVNMLERSESDNVKFFVGRLVATHPK